MRSDDLTPGAVVRTADPVKPGGLGIQLDVSRLALRVVRRSEHSVTFAPIGETNPPGAVATVVAKTPKTGWAVGSAWHTRYALRLEHRSHAGTNFENATEQP